MAGPHQAPPADATAAASEPADAKAAVSEPADAKAAVSEPARATATASSAPATSVELARRVGEAMFAADAASREFMQMALVSCEPGRAVMRMTVREPMLNGHRICHGGFIFTLADSTFAFACNSHNKVAVAAGCSIEFLKPGQLGDVLTCEGREQTLSGRHGIYDMTVTNQRGEVIALFRGKSAQIQGSIVPA